MTIIIDLEKAFKKTPIRGRYLSKKGVKENFLNFQNKNAAANFRHNTETEYFPC